METAAPLRAQHRKLLELRLRKKASATKQIQAGPRGSEPRPLSFSQERMWFLWRLEPETPVYNGSLCLRFKGELDVPVLERALNEIWRRHDVLRAHFPSPEGRPVQVVRPWKPESLPVVNLELIESPDREGELVLLARRVVLQPYDLEAGPITRWMLARMASHEHVLILGFHHIVFDAWSRQVVQRELEQLYSAFARGDTSPLPELPIQYADFAQWQRQQGDTPQYGEALDHWLQHLGGELPVLVLPIGRPWPTHRTYQGAEMVALLPTELTSALRTFAQQEGATLFMVLLAALKALLHRYTGLEDIIVGSPVAGRTMVETEPLMGCLVNTLATRSRVESATPFRALLRAERQVVLAAFEHQAAPFEQVVEKLSPERASNRTPIFQAVLNLRNVPTVATRWEQLEVARWDFEAGISQFDLALGLDEKDNGLAVICRFSTELFETRSMRRFLDHWQTLLEGIAHQPDARLSELPLLTEAERRQLLAEWNQTERPYPRERCVPELFEEQAQAHPDAVAVCLNEVVWTFGELDCRAETIAARLQAMGVGPDQLVGLCVERSLEMVAALLGILKAGGAYWPLDAALPDERLRMLLKASRPAVLIVSERAQTRIRELTACAEDQPPVVMTIEELASGASEVPDRTRPRIQPENLAYVMYTSGSTGRPKGVMVPHRGVVRLVKNADYASLSAAETFLQLAPLSFDASTFEIWGALLNGGRLALMPPGQPIPSEIGDAIRRNGVTTLWLTASLFHLMVEERLVDLKPLRQLLAGGDVLSPSHVVRALRGLPGCRLINGYGPTENTTFTCCHTIPPETDGSHPLPIGRPIANTRVYVLDPHLQPVPIGVPGELYAGGDGVARGYLDDPERTTERFLPDPFSRVPGDRVYRTGDLVRRLEDGTLEFLGRLDRQVKIRGFRVEPEEVEAVLLDCPGVKEAAVVVREAAGEKQLVAYLAAAPAGPRSSQTWRELLATRLPDYMVPAVVVALEVLPRTAHDKIDRAALPPPEPVAVQVAKVPEDPISLLEVELLRIWQRLFGRSDIGRHDNFFDLGGHSLMAARLASDVERLLKHRLPLASIFQSPTVASLARRLQAEDWVPAWSSLVPLQPLGSRPPFFFMHGWGGDVFAFVHLARRLAPEQPVYGLQAVGLDGRQPRHTSVEEMATHYAREMRSLQKHGPYYLGGYSLGGWIAWEVARQLCNQGQVVGMLALLDTAATCNLPRPWRLRILIRRLPRRLAVHCWRFIQLPAHDRGRYFKGRLAALHFFLQGNQPQRSAPYPTLSPPLLTEADPDGDYYRSIASRYQPAELDTAVDLFRCYDSPDDSLFAFRRLVRGEMRIHPVPAGHFTMLDESHVASFAAVFLPALQQAQGCARLGHVP